MSEVFLAEGQAGGFVQHVATQASGESQKGNKKKR